MYEFSIEISLKFVPNDPINNIPALVQMMAWQQAIIWTNDGIVYWHLYASLGLNEYMFSPKWFWFIFFIFFLLCY